MAQVFPLLMFCPTFHAKSSGPLLVDVYRFSQPSPGRFCQLLVIFSQFSVIFRQSWLNTLISFSQFQSGLVKLASFNQTTGDKNAGIVYWQEGGANQHPKNGGFPTKFKRNRPDRWQTRCGPYGACTLQDQTLKKTRTPPKLPKIIPKTIRSGVRSSSAHASYRDQVIPETIRSVITEQELSKITQK